MSAKVLPARKPEDTYDKTGKKLTGIIFFQLVTIFLDVKPSPNISMTRVKDV